MPLVGPLNGRVSRAAPHKIDRTGQPRTLSMVGGINARAPSPWSGTRFRTDNLSVLNLVIWPGSGSGSARVSGSRLREDLREGVPVQRCRRVRPGALSGQVDAFTVERCQDQPAGLRLREGVPIQRCRVSGAVSPWGSAAAGSDSGRGTGTLPDPTSNRPGSARLTGSARGPGPALPAGSPWGSGRSGGRLHRGAVPGSTGRAPRG